MNIKLVADLPSTTQLEDLRLPWHCSSELWMKLRPFTMSLVGERLDHHNQHQHHSDHHKPLTH